MSRPPATPEDATHSSVYAASDLLPGQLLAERYRIEGLLGIGGMGVVYRATDQALEVPVAIKLLRPELAQREEAFERFRQELLLARQVASPHVVRIHDLARDGNRWFISMDLIEGEPLDRRIDREGALPLEQALAIARQVAEGLAAAHARGIVHRDLKPSNVLIDAAGAAWIADFGVARSLGTSGLTQAGAMVGTPDYLSPEQAQGGPIDARSDLYALGLLLYEMLTGRLPFDAATAAEAISQRIAGTPPPLRRVRSDAPVWVERLVARLLRPKPAHRFRDAREVIAAIDARRAPFDWRRWWQRAMPAATAILLAVLAGLWWRSAPPPSLQPLPPARILILAEAPRDRAEAARLEAIAEQLRLALQTRPGLAVVDAERSHQALAQLTLPDGAGANPADLAAELPGARLLRLRRAEDGGDRLRARLWRDGNDGRVEDIDLGTPEDAVARALAALLPAVSGRPLPPAVPAAAQRTYGEGLLLRAGGNPVEAEASFAEAQVIAPDAAAIALARAEAAWQLGNAAHARSVAAAAATTAGPPLQEMLALIVAAIDGDLETATALLRQRIDAVPDDLSARLRLAWVHGENGELALALDELQALVARDPGDPRAWFLLGKYSLLRGDVRAAVDEHLLRALVLYKRARNLFGESEAVNALGVGYARLGQLGEAEEQYRKAVALRRAIGNLRGVASSLRNLAQIAIVQGRHAEAGEQLEQARALFASLEDLAGLAAVDNELGLLAEERGDPAAALAAYRLALRGREALGDALAAAESLNNIGFAHYQLGDYDSAGVYWRQADEAFAALGDLNGRTRTQQNLGLLELARGRWPDARRLLEASLQTAERQQLAEEAAVSLRNLAELELAQGHLAAALERLARAETLFAERDDRRGLADALLLRARVHLAAFDAEGARAALRDGADQLHEGSLEQRAWAALLEAQIAAELEPAQVPRRLAEAAALATQVGVRALQLQVAITQPIPADALETELHQLGHRQLWLRWLETALQRALAANDADTAQARYRETVQALHGLGDYQRAWHVHRAGIRALRLAGVASGDAEAAAAAARQTLLDAAPAALRARIERETAADAD